MRHLLGTFPPSLWSTVSAGVFLVTFLAILAYVYRGKSRALYDKIARLPMDDQETDINRKGEL